MRALAVESLDAADGIRIVDRVSAHQIEFRSDAPLAPTDADHGAFPFPIERAVDVRAERLVLPIPVATYVRAADGSMIAGFTHGSREAFPPDRYYVELNTPIKAYLAVEAGVAVRCSNDDVRIEFDAPTEIRVGVRSPRNQPYESITTTTDGADLLETLSNFRVGLQSTAPERAYPTLRGHPPEVALGETFSPPRGDRRDAAIRLELPPEPAYAFPAASLAYYLGADVVPGSTPKLVTEGGFEYPFPRAGYEAAVARALKRCFLLDALTATEGHYEVDLHARRALEPELPLDFGALYEAAPHERVEAYLDVPHADVAAHVPTWPLEAYVEPDPEHVTALPYLVDDLATISVVDPPRVQGPEARSVALAAFTEPETPRSAGDVFAGEESFVRLAAVDTGDDLSRTVWVGSDVPLGADEFLAAGARHRHRRAARDGRIRAALVCNDPEMAPEATTAREVYGSRPDVRFDLSIHRDLGVERLREIVASDVDFLHYVGHATPTGLRCPDGEFDVAAVAEVGVDTFVLNGCQSYRQGIALVENGAIGGAVALSDVENEDAIDIGLSLSRLLNAGFPFRAAIALARRTSFTGGQYLVVGDGSIALAQEDGGAPYACRILEAGDPVTVELRTFTTPISGLGTLVSFQLEAVDGYYLAARRVGPLDVPRADLETFLALEPIPVLYDGDVYWSGDGSIERLLAG